MSLRVLFVNDDETVLSGLRASLRRHRRQWSMQFVTSHELDERLDADTFDVVVTELVLAAHDGWELLSRLKLEQPTAIRVVLSGSADQRGAMRAAQVAHQYLSMPCEPTELIRRIERSEKLRAFLSSERVAKLGLLGDLPSPPAVYHELREKLLDPQASVIDVARVVERDPAASAKVLQLVNSAFFSRVREITSIEGAVSMLGMDLLQGLILQQGVVNALTAVPAGLSVEGESQHGILTAMVARHIAPPADKGAAFTGALLHDVGKLLLGQRFGAAYTPVLRGASPGEADLEARERDALDVTHAEVGAYLLGVWGLPDTMVESVAWHHQPCSVDRANLDVVAIVHIADAVVHEQPVDPKLVEQLRLAELLPAWRAWFEEQQGVGS